LHEKPQTPESEEAESESFEPRRKKVRCDRSGSEEADLQIALAKLDLDTDMPDAATLQHAYRQRMEEISNIAPDAEVADKCTDLTQAFRLVATHLELL